MHIDPLLPVLVLVACSALGLALIFRLLGQPSILGYLLAGVVVGPQGLALVNDLVIIQQVGSLGVILLLFYIGMEINPGKLMANWYVPVVGTMLQIAISVGCVFVVGYFFEWPLGRTLLLGFVISLSSTAVVLKLLQDNNELLTPPGQNVLGILLVQDLAVVPMIIGLGVVAGDDVNVHRLSLQALGGLSALAFVFWLVRSRPIQLPSMGVLSDDRELQIFLALICCFGFSLLTGMMELSTALGAFLSGMFVAKIKGSGWVQHSLEPFRVVFVAVFFMSVGMLIDLEFVKNQWKHLCILLVLVLLTNTFINAFILRFLKVSWRESLYVGALLAQIGEFSFILSALGLSMGLITQYSYQVTITVIALSLLISPVWIAFFKRITHFVKPSGAPV